MFPSVTAVVAMARTLKDDQLWMLYKLLQKLDKEDIYFKQIEAIVIEMVSKDTNKR